MRSPLPLALTLVLLLGVGDVPPVSAQDYKQAPPAEELDRRADDYVTGRRVVVVILVVGTLVGGMAGSVSRRLARRRAAREAREADAGSRDDA